MSGWNPSTKKTVYILGAGTSTCCGAPVTATFREAAQRVADRTRIHWGDSLIARQNEKAFNETLEMWTAKFGSYNVEEFYVLADLHERMRLASITQTKLRPLADAVRYLICKTLDEAMTGPASAVHHDFVKHTWHHAAERSENVTVLTFNWDIALDNAVDRFFAQPALNAGYEDFHPWSSRREGDTRPYRVLKMHGSVNWWFCKDCKVLWYDGERKSILSYWEDERRKCPTGKCGNESLVPGMVPPVSQKMEKSDLYYFMHSIWYEARKALRECNWLVVAGYSLPPTDVQFRMFLAEAMAFNEHLEGVTILSNRKVGEARTRFEDSYAQLIGSLPSGIQVNFRYEGFERWVGNQCGGR